MTFCVVCGKEIPEERMEVVPETVLCVEHARAITKYGGEFKVTGVMGNIGKAGSLKKNYGGLEVHRQRNMDGLSRLQREFRGESD